MQFDASFGKQEIYNPISTRTERDARRMRFRSRKAAHTDGWWSDIVGRVDGKTSASEILSKLKDVTSDLESLVKTVSMVQDGTIGATPEQRREMQSMIDTASDDAIKLYELVEKKPLVE